MKLPITRMISRLMLTVFVVLASIASISTASLAETNGPDISAQEAFARQEQHSLVLVDIRTEDEWRQTGIAQNALPISMLDPQFVQKIIALQTQNSDKEIAFVCASSRRSGYLQGELAKHGFKGVFSVYGGMTGNGKTPGWIAEGLPVTPWSGNGS